MAKRSKKSSKGTITALIVVAILGLLGGGIGFGMGNGKGNGDSTGTDDGENKVVETQTDKEENSKLDKTIISVTVSGSDYFYKNEKISFDNLINEIQKNKKDVLVEIKDENASFNAYSKLQNKLDELHIDYTEK